MNIIKAVQDPKLLLPYLAADGDLTSWRNWLVFLKVLYGLPIPESEYDVVRRCTGRDPSKLPKEGFTECLVLAGRRSGKSKVIGLVGAYEAALAGRETRVSAGEIPVTAVISPTRNQSRIIHTYVAGVFDGTPMLRNELVEERRESFVLKNGTEVTILAGDPKTSRGFSLTCCIVDEIAMHGLSEESKVRSDTELVRALRPSLATTGGKLICIGTPWKAAGYAYQTFKRGFGNDECDVLVWNAPSTFMNPSLPVSVVERAIAEDAIAARVEYCVETGLFRDDVDNFITRAAVEALVISGRKELPPRRNVAYCAFVDMSGGRHDDACLAIGHREGDKVILDLLEAHKSPHVPAAVVREMAAAMRRYEISRATSDAYAAEWSRSEFATNGIKLYNATTTIWKEAVAALTKVAKPKSVLYAELLPRLHSGQTELLDDETLIAQLSSLQRRVRSGARDSIDHPPGAKDDVANAFAGVVDTVMQRPPLVISGYCNAIGGSSTGKTPLQRQLEIDAKNAAQDLAEQLAWINDPNY